MQVQHGHIASLSSGSWACLEGLVEASTRNIGSTSQKMSPSRNGRTESNFTNCRLGPPSSILYSLVWERKH